MNLFTRTFLILLRLAIGWHFFFEGLDKVLTYVPAPPPEAKAVHTQYGWPPSHPVRPAPPGPKAPGPKKAWSSEGFLREAKGPLAGVYHWVAGDQVLDRVVPRPAEAAEPADKLHRRMPPGLEKDWDAYFDAFVKHYHVEGKQLDQLRATLDQRKEKTVRFLLHGDKIVERPAPAGNATVETKETIPQRVKEYEDRVTRLHELEGMDPVADFRPDLPGEIADARAKVNESRSELQGIADGQTAEMKEALESVLTPQQKAEGAVPEPVAPSVSAWDRLDWANFLLRWGLLVIGGCLLLGLLTRLAAVLGALFLLSVYLANPVLPLPLPHSPAEETAYLLALRTVIEMLALLALATTLSGRWLGLDGLLQFLAPRRWRRRVVPQETVVVKHEEVRPVAAPAHPRPAGAEAPGRAPAPHGASNPKEPPHGA